MRVAVITPYLPWPADTGGKLRSYYLLKGLAEVAEVDLFTVCYGATPPAGKPADFCRSVAILAMQNRSPRREFWQAWFNPTPKAVRHFAAPATLRAVHSRVAQGYDLLVCDEICMTPYIDWPADRPSPPRLVIRHKVDHLHYRETAQQRPVSLEKYLDLLESRRLEKYERAKMPLFQAAVVCSPEDGDVVAQQGRGLELRVLVNGADTDYFTPVRQPDEAPTILILGTMSYFPNIDAAQHFFQAIHPALLAEIPNLQVLVVGHAPPPEVQAFGALPGVTVTGSVEDVRPYMARSWMMAVPLRLGGGTRLKIVEAMAAGLPVASTTVGAQGIDAVDGEHLLLADAAPAFVDTTLRLLRDGPLRTRVADAGLQLARRHYSWQSLGKEYANFCLEIANRTNDRNTSTDHPSAKAERLARSAPPVRVSGA